MKTITCRKIPTPIKREEMTVALPIAEHIHGRREPQQRVFVSHRVPWRYYYAKGAKMRGLANRAISGMGWNWYMSKGKTLQTFPKQELHGTNMITKERDNAKKAQAANAARSDAFSATTSQPKAKSAQHEDTNGRL